MRAGEAIVPSPAGVSTRRRALDAGPIGLVLAVVVFAAVLDAWTFRQVLGSDGVSYLDIGDAYLSGHLHSAINAFWSPLYSLIVGTVLALAPVSASRELPLVHAVNLLIFAATLTSFGFFLAELIRHREASLPALAARPLLSSRALCCVALVAFAWGAGRLIGVGRVTPDLLVAALWFAALALLLRSFRLPDSRRVLVALGVVLGLGYLAKTAMLPIALSFVVVSAFTGDLRRGLYRGLIVAGALAAVSVPFAVAISVKSDRATIGTSSELGYAWLVHGAPPFVNLPNEHTSPLLRRAPRPLLHRPPTFAFGAPVGGTFPLWYDPTYWYDGTRATFDLGAQLRAVRHSGRVYLDMLRVAPGMELLAGLGLLTLLTARARLPTRRLLAYLRFLVPAFAGLALYAAVHVEPRFVGAFLTTVFVGLFSALPFPRGRRRGWAAFAVVAAVIVTGLWFGARTPVLSAAGTTAPWRPHGETQPTRSRPRGRSGGPAWRVVTGSRWLATPPSW